MVRPVHSFGLRSWIGAISFTDEHCYMDLVTAYDRNHFKLGLAQHGATSRQSIINVSGLTLDW
ncbi:MAG: hypothetical protein IPF93_15130 [Saprospiraceae bacterium]|nr:hypothetical protein [Saprospiraceae bacterium]